MPSLRRYALALVAVLAVGVSGVVAVGGSGAVAATGCAVDYTVSSQWSGGFTASVGVRNLGDPLTGWNVVWTFADGQKVTSGWNATVTQNGAQVTASSLSYNGGLGSGASTSFGFQGTWTSGNPVPVSFALNGVNCTGGVAPPSTTVSPTTASPTITPTPTPTTPTPTKSSSACPVTGHITYTLNRAANPTSDQSSAYALITTAMTEALSVYNCYANVTKALSVNYVPSVATADANINGTIRFGARSTMQQITAMHEVSHTMGVGTASSWSSHLSGGIWTGSNATNQLRAITGDQSASVHGDSQHFWPYGLNYTSEVSSSADLVAHCRMVVALRQDLGL